MTIDLNNDDYNDAVHTALDIEQMATDFQIHFPMDTLRDMDKQLMAQSGFFARAFDVFAQKADAALGTGTPAMDDFRLAALMSDRFRALYRLIDNTRFRREMVDLAGARVELERKKLYDRD